MFNFINNLYALNEKSLSMKMVVQIKYPSLPIKNENLKESIYTNIQIYVRIEITRTII